MVRVQDFAVDGKAVDLSNRQTHEANQNARSIGKILGESRKVRLSPWIAYRKWTPHYSGAPGCTRGLKTDAAGGPSLFRRGA